MARVLVTVLVLALVAAAAQAGEKQHIAGALKLAGNLAAHGHPGAAAKVVVNAGKEEAHKVADAVRHKVAAVKAVVHHEKQHVAGALHAAAALAKHGHAGAAGKVLAHVGKEELHKVSAALHSHSKRSVVEKIVAAKKVEAIVNSLPPKKPTLADKVKNFKKQHQKKPTLGQKVGKVLAAKQELHKRHQKKATLGEKVRHVLAAKKVANALSNAHSIGKRHVVPQVGEKHHIAGALKLAGHLAAHGHPGAALKVVVNAGKEEAHKVADAVRHKVAAVKAVVHHEKQHVAGALHAAAALAKHGHAGAAGKVLAHVGKEELHKVSAALHSHSKRNVVEKIHNVVEATHGHQPAHQPQQRHKILNTVHTVVEARNIISHLPRH